MRCRGFVAGNEHAAGQWFVPGNAAAVTHGARSEGKLRPIAERYLERLRAQAPTGKDVEDEFALERLAWVLARIDAAEQWIDKHGVVDTAGAPQPVLSQLSTWENSARRLMVELGLTAGSRAALRLELLRGDELISEFEVRAWMVQFIRAAIAIMPAHRERLLALADDPELALPSGTRRPGS